MKKLLILAFAFSCALSLSAAPAATPAKPAVTNAVPRLTEPRSELTSVEFVKLTNNILSVKVGNSRNNLAYSVGKTAKFQVETNQLEQVPGKEGQTRFKTVECKASDLKPGQRIKVVRIGTAVSEVTILQPKDAKTEKK